MAEPIPSRQELLHSIDAWRTKQPQQIVECNFGPSQDTNHANQENIAPDTMAKSVAAPAASKRFASPNAESPAGKRNCTAAGSTRPRVPNILIGEGYRHRGWTCINNPRGVRIAEETIIPNSQDSDSSETTRADTPLSSPAEVRVEIPIETIIEVPLEVPAEEEEESKSEGLPGKGLETKFGKEEFKTIMRWMKQNKGSTVTGHEKEFEVLLSKLGFKHAAYKESVRKTLRTRVVQALYRKKNAMRASGAVTSANDSTGPLEFADWTDAWLSKDWDGCITKPNDWDARCKARQHSGGSEDESYHEELNEDVSEDNSAAAYQQQDIGKELLVVEEEIDTLGHEYDIMRLKTNPILLPVPAHLLEPHHAYELAGLRFPPYAMPEGYAIGGNPPALSQPFTARSTYFQQESIPVEQPGFRLGMGLLTQAQQSTIAGNEPDDDGETIGSDESRSSGTPSLEGSPVLVNSYLQTEPIINGEDEDAAQRVSSGGSINLLVNLGETEGEEEMEEDEEINVRGFVEIEDEQHVNREEVREEFVEINAEAGKESEGESEDIEESEEGFESNEEDFENDEEVEEVDLLSTSHLSSSPNNISTSDPSSSSPLTSTPAPSSSPSSATPAYRIIPPTNAFSYYQWLAQLQVLLQPTQSYGILTGEISRPEEPNLHITVVQRAYDREFTEWKAKRDVAMWWVMKTMGKECREEVTRAMGETVNPREIKEFWGERFGVLSK